jgi:hypothetical protein
MVVELEVLVPVVSEPDDDPVVDVVDPAFVPEPEPVANVEPSFFEAQPPASAHARPAAETRESVEVCANLIGSSAT